MNKIEFRNLLVHLAKGPRSRRTLSRDEARESLGFLLSEEATNEQAAAFLTAMRLKGAETDELTGFCEAIHNRSVTIRPNVKNLIVSASPYSGRLKTLHLTVPAAITASAAGVAVILHSSGNTPPKHGLTASHILSELGLHVTLSPDQAKSMLENVGFAFLHSSQFSPALEKLHKVRDSLYYQTFINTCEVLSNPANAGLMIFGAAHLTYLEKMVNVAKNLNAEHVIGVAGIEASDEAPLRTSVIYEYKGGSIEKQLLKPENFGLDLEKSIYPPMSAAETAQLITDTLEGKDKKYRDAIILNAGIRIYIGKKASNMEEGIEMARELLKSRASFSKLKEIRKAQ